MYIGYCGKSGGWNLRVIHYYTQNTGSPPYLIFTVWSDSNTGETVNFNLSGTEQNGTSSAFSFSASGTVKADKQVHTIGNSDSIHTGDIKSFTFNLSVGSGVWSTNDSGEEYRPAKTLTVNPMSGSKIYFGDTFNVTISGEGSKANGFTYRVRRYEKADYTDESVMTQIISGVQAGTYTSSIPTSQISRVSTKTDHKQYWFFLFAYYVGNNDSQQDVFVKYQEPAQPVATSDLYVPESAGAIISVKVEEGNQNFPSSVTKYVQDVSQLAVTVTAKGQYNATIDSIKTTYNGGTYSGAEFTTNVITASGNTELKVTVKDSRGISRTVTQNILVAAYSPPVIRGCSVYRCAADDDTTADPEGDHACVIPSGSITSLDGENAGECVVRYKKISQYNYTAVTIPFYDAVLDGEYAIFEANVGSGYDVNVTLTDIFNNSVRFVCSPLHATGALIHILKSRDGMGIFQRVPANQHGLWVAGDVHLTGMQYEVATLQSASLGGNFKDQAPAQYGINSAGQGLYIPLQTYRSGNLYLTLCIDTETMKFGAYKYDADTSTGSFTAF